jgi:hypothetical protein
MLHDELQMVQCNAGLHFYSHILKEGYEGCNHIAISQCALLYQYLPHQFDYGFLQNANARLQCMNFIYFIILNFNSEVKPHVDQNTLI